MARPAHHHGHARSPCARLNSDMSTDLLATCASARPHPYRLIHKALRGMLAHTLQQAGALDPSLPAERAIFTQALTQVLALCEHHIAHEERCFHAPLQGAGLRALRPIAHDHEAQREAIQAMRLALLQMNEVAVSEAAEAEPPAALRARGQALYLSLSELVADKLAHMVEEEHLLTRALWAQCDDDTLAGFVRTWHQTLPEDLRALQWHWLQRTAQPHELASLPAPALPGTAQG